jgi:phosphate transport system permease protein
MNAKRVDKIATAVIYLLVGIVILILVALLGFILITGLPHVTWSFLTSPASAFNAGGGIGDQLFNSFYLLFLTLLISFSNFAWSWNLLSGICEEESSN